MVIGTHCLPAACLHWGLRAGDTYLDPLQLVGGPMPVRLLPLDSAAPLRRPVAARPAPAALAPSLSGGRLALPRAALGAAAGAVVAARSS